MLLFLKIKAISSIAYLEGKNLKFHSYIKYNFNKDSFLFIEYI